MGWRNYDVKEQKMLFVSEWLQKAMPLSELCRCYGISRKTGYKLINRYEQEQQNAFEERSRARHTIGNKTPPEIIDRLLAVKQRFPYFGPEKIRDWLMKNEPIHGWPAVSTIGSILKRHDLVKPRKYRRRQVGPYTEPFLDCRQANQVWSADFKGKFLLGNDRYCYPLTITDNYSRFLLSCEGMYRPTLKETKNCFEKIFYLYGLPDSIRTDNGTPFAGTGVTGLSRLSIWWLKLGILPERIKPGCPEQNGRHERMHRTLKEAATKPAKSNLRKQQARFDEFVKEYNEDRPHNALGKKCPMEVYRSSSRSLPSRIPDICYPDKLEIRFVRSNGEMRWEGKTYFISELLYKEPIGIEVIEENKLAIYFARLKLGVLDLDKGKLIKE